jgi:DNA-binding NtrC family response regulator
MVSGPKILIVDDDANIVKILRKFLDDAGHENEGVYSGVDAIELIRRDPNIVAVLLDIRMPGLDGVETLKSIKQIEPDIEVVMMTAEGTIESAVECMQLGAADYITKPFKREGVLSSIDRVLTISNLQTEVRRLKEELYGKYSFNSIVGRSDTMRRLFERLANASRNESTVLIVGESGTGKELAARAIHYNGYRKDGPFVPINCAALPSELIESELFGYKKGAFTGATTDSLGLFRAADGGTLFLDEIISMPIGTQAKLLRVLQDKKIRPIGGTEEADVDVRVIAASNRPPQEAVAEDLLREDLFYRLSVLSVELPPLRDRRDDIPVLVEHFIEKFNKRKGRKIEGIDAKALELMQRYSWPGNVRELENCIESIFALGRETVISEEDLPPHVASGSGSAARAAAGLLGEDEVISLAEMEKIMLERALRMTKGNKSKAATVLGISRKRLYNMLDRYGIERA